MMRLSVTHLWKWHFPHLEAEVFVQNLSGQTSEHTEHSAKKCDPEVILRRGGECLAIVRIIPTLFMSYCRCFPTQILVATEVLWITVILHKIRSSLPFCAVWKIDKIYLFLKPCCQYFQTPPVILWSFFQWWGWAGNLILLLRFTKLLHNCNVIGRLFKPNTVALVGKSAIGIH